MSSIRHIWRRNRYRAIMIMAGVGSIPKVSGRSMAMVAEVPRPGRIPTNGSEKAAHRCHPQIERGDDRRETLHQTIQNIHISPPPSYPKETFGKIDFQPISKNKENQAAEYHTVIHAFQDAVAFQEKSRTVTRRNTDKVNPRLFTTSAKPAIDQHDHCQPAE